MATPVHALTHHTDGIARSIVTTVEIENVFGEGSLLRTKGIWDTGATNSVITRSVAEALGLQSIGYASVMGIHGVKRVPVYYVKIVLNNRNISLVTNVTECDELSADYSVGLLIGMDLITQGDFAISNSGGRSTMSFRVPSVECIDFEK